MQKLLGIIFISIGLFGLIVYPLRGTIISTDNAISMLLGFFMIIIGTIIIYSDSKGNGQR